MDERTRALLAQVDLLAGLTTTHLREIEPLVHLRCYARRQVIVADQDRTTDLLMILQGRVTVAVYAEDGREVSFRDLKAGASFGELAAIDGEPRSATVIAAEPTLIGTLAASDYREALRRYPSMTDATLRRLAFYVRALSARIAELTYTVEVRVCAELERLARDAGAVEGRVELRPSPRRGEIASRVNTTREQVSRTVSQLQQAGLVMQIRGALVIPDLAQLVAWRRKAMGGR